MARISVLLALGLVLAVGVAGCAPEGGPEAGNGAAPTRVDPGYDLDALLAALNAVEGVEVEVLEGEVEAPITSDLFDEAEVYALRVNRDPVYVYQFANQEAATVAAAMDWYSGRLSHTPATITPKTTSNNVRFIACSP